MRWEQRDNGTYYYTAERVGNRVVKQYVGSGTVGELASQLDEITRQERDAKQAADRAVRV